MDREEFFKKYKWAMYIFVLAIMLFALWYKLNSKGQTLSPVGWLGAIVLAIIVIALYALFYKWWWKKVKEESKK